MDNLDTGNRPVLERVYSDLYLCHYAPLVAVGYAATIEFAGL